MTPDDAEELMHDDDLNERRTEEDAIAADIASANQERDPHFYTPFCECSSCRVTAEYLHEKHIGSDPYAGVRANQERADTTHATLVFADGSSHHIFGTRKEMLDRAIGFGQAVTHILFCDEQPFFGPEVKVDPFAGVRAGHALLDDVKAQYEGWQKDEPVSKKARRIVERYFEDKPYDGELRGQLFDLIMGAFR